MTDRTYVLIPGAGGSAWYWHRLVPELRRRGHDAVAVDLPAADDSAGLWEYADTVVNAVGDRDNVVVVAPFDPLVYFFHDVPAHIAEEGMTTEQPQSSTPFTQPWPLAAWPDVPTRVLSGRQDRLFPVEFQSRVAQQRLGITPETMAGGHLVALSQPEELAARLGA